MAGGLTTLLPGTVAPQLSGLEPTSNQGSQQCPVSKVHSHPDLPPPCRAWGVCQRPPRCLSTPTYPSIHSSTQRTGEGSRTPQSPGHLELRTLGSLGGFCSALDTKELG